MTSSDSTMFSNIYTAWYPKLHWMSSFRSLLFGGFHPCLASSDSTLFAGHTSLISKLGQYFEDNDNNDHDDDNNDNDLHCMTCQAFFRSFHSLRFSDRAVSITTTTNNNNNQQ